MSETYTVRGLDSQFWRKVRIYAASEGLTVKETVVRALQKLISEGQGDSKASKSVGIKAVNIGRKRCELPIVTR